MTLRELTHTPVAFVHWLSFPTSRLTSSDRATANKNLAFLERVAVPFECPVQHLKFPGVAL